MLRRVLSAYLVFLTVAAPCLCCCTAGRLLAAAPPSEPPAPPACCCHDDTSADPQPAPRPHIPAPEPRCPCRDHSDMPSQVTVGPNAVDLSLHRDMLDAAPLTIPVLGPSSVAELLGLLQVREPFPSATDLLHVHHRLRC
jgi:hypothetical protein